MTLALRCRLSHREESISSVMNGSQSVAAQSEEILNKTVHRQETLRLVGLARLSEML